jgi:lipopolysaccharide export system permease protein
LFKKLDILIIRSFIGPFIITFSVSLFVLVMQFFWLYMDELIGKGLSIWMILQLLLYMSTTLVPLALPLSVLLSSIMTFGNMGENFELVAIKSSGISLLRFMRPLGYFVLVICGAAFIFNNNVIPVANLKALSLLYDVRNSKPTLNIKPDQFNNDIQGFSIRVGSKDEDGFTIHDILIYDHTGLVGNNKVILAKEGQMMPTSDKQALIFRLKDGWIYDEGYEHNTHAANYPQTRMHFAKWDKAFDLSAFNFTRTNQDLFKNAYQMMDVKQLYEAIDSLGKTNRAAGNTIASYIAPYITIANGTKEAAAVSRRIDSAQIGAGATYKTSFTELVHADKRVTLLQSTANNLRNLKALMNNNTLMDKLGRENFLKFSIEFHRKFALSFACLLLFLIGAPLGAIIRKGGLGLPLVFAVAFFITFHILNITGEKIAKTASVPAWVGMWMSTAILFPVAIWLIVTARNDSQIFTKELYLRGWRAIKSLFPKKQQAIV